MTSQQALKKLAESEGLDEFKMHEKAMFNGVAPGICLECGHIDTTEPDQTEGYCEGCGKQTIQSCLILAGLI